MGLATHAAGRSLQTAANGKKKATKTTLGIFNLSNISILNVKCDGILFKMMITCCLRGNVLPRMWSEPKLTTEYCCACKCAHQSGVNYRTFGCYNY